MNKVNSLVNLCKQVNFFGKLLQQVFKYSLILNERFSKW